MASVLPSQSERPNLKLVLAGSSGCGKTTLVGRHGRGEDFNPNTKATIGTDFCRRQYTVKGKTRTADIWDTAGQERFRALGPTYWRGADGILLVYDVADEMSFEDVEDWIQDLRMSAPDAVIMLVGNKCDRSDRQVTTKEGKMMAEIHGLLFMETSAKLNECVDEVFQTLVEAVEQRLSEFSDSSSSSSGRGDSAAEGSRKKNVRLQTGDRNSNSRCC